MKSYRYLFTCTSVVLAAIVMLAACTDKDLYPIFYTLENERALADDRGMPDEANVYDFAKSGTRYFAAANTLYTREETGDWSSVAPPVSGALCNTIEVFGGNLYAGFFTEGGTGLGVYYTDPDTISWSKVPDANVQDVEIGFVKQAGPLGSELFFVCREGGSSDYSLWYSDDPLSTPFAESTSTDFPPTPTGYVSITDIVYDGAVYWVIAGPYLYSGAEDNLLEVAGGPTNPRSSSFGGLLDSPVVYVSTKDGELWSYNGAWTGPSTVSEDGDDVQFTGFIDVTGISGDILVGSQGTGYFRLIGGDVNNTERFKEYNVSALYSGTINGFFLDGTTLFARTIGNGLWRAGYTGTEWEWKQE